MSRIREALKKAAEERSAHVEANSTESLMDVLSVGPVEPPGAAPTPPRPEKAIPQKCEEQNYLSLIAKCRRMHWEIKAPYSVFAHGGNRLVAERFRTLRSRLYQIAATQPLKRVLLTSSIPAEGKTFVASNLAQSMVRQSDRKVILIDADLRASQLHLTLGTEGEPGLSDYLAGGKELSDVIQLGEADNFCFIPGGTYVANPSEILQSEQMKALLNYLGQVFDWVILDSPPAAAVHDASALGDMCDGVVFVIRAGTTDYELAEKVAAEFQEKNLLGVVLNRADKSACYGDYYYDYRYPNGN